MSGVAIFWTVVLTNFVAACFAGWVAEQNGRQPYGWFLLSLLFGVLALIAVAGAPPRWETDPSVPRQKAAT